MEGRYIDIHTTLVNRCKAGDARVQSELYHAYARAMYNVCRRIKGNEKDAEDVSLWSKRLASTYKFKFKRPLVLAHPSPQCISKFSIIAKSGYFILST